MEIITIVECKRELPSGAIQSYPAGKQFDVPADIGRKWIGEGKATAAAIAPGAAFTPEQVAVLTAAADHALAVTAAATADAADGETTEGSSGELTVDPDPDEQHVDLNAMSINDLRALAREVGIKGAQTMSRAAIVAELEARRK